MAIEKCCLFPELENTEVDFDYVNSLKEQVKNKEITIYDFDNKIRKKYKCDLICGCDEAGRGPILGPVVCSSVIVNKDFYDERINDSKKLTENLRESLYDIIIDNALYYKIEIVDRDTIDKINILEASRLGMQKGYDYIKSNYCTEKKIVCITDYMKLKLKDSDLLINISKGDASSFSVACASILSKVTRDRLLRELSNQYPQYNLSHNKGYGTRDHIEAIKKYGIIESLHRKSFRTVKEYLQSKKI